MGTRSSTTIVDHSGTTPVTLARLYIQYDGYPTGVGAQIKELIGAKRVVNGYSDGVNEMNGAGCMAAMLIDGLKDGCGGVYLIDPAGDQREEYNYTVRARGPGEPVELQVSNFGGTVYYDGPLADFDPVAAEGGEAA